MPFTSKITFLVLGKHSGVAVGTTSGKTPIPTYSRKAATRCRHSRRTDVARVANRHTTDFHKDAYVRICIGKSPLRITLTSFAYEVGGWKLGGAQLFSTTDMPLSHDEEHADKRFMCHNSTKVFLIIFQK